MSNFAKIWTFLAKVSHLSNFKCVGFASLRRPSEDIKSKQTKKALQSLPLRASRNTRDTGHVYHVTASKYNAAQSRDRPRGMTSLQKICSENGRDCKALLALLLRKSAARCARVEGLI